MNLGSTIKHIRTRRGITQTEFATRCGITQTYLSKIERNSREPNLSILQAISNQLGLPLPILFFLTLDKEDIDEGKRDTFEILEPSLKSFIDELFKI